MSVVRTLRVREDRVQFPAPRFEHPLLARWGEEAKIATDLKIAQIVVKILTA